MDEALQESGGYTPNMIPGKNIRNKNLNVFCPDGWLINNFVDTENNSYGIVLTNGYRNTEKEDKGQNIRIVVYKNEKKAEKELKDLLLNKFKSCSIIDFNGDVWERCGAKCTPGWYEGKNVYLMFNQQYPKVIVIFDYSIYEVNKIFDTSLRKILRSIEVIE